MRYDVAIIGGGPAGYTAAEKAAANGLTTLLFEKNALGGVCLNEGCVPTKTLLYSAKVYDTIKHAGKYAVGAENPTFDFPKIIARKNKVVKKLTAGIRMKMKENGVEVVVGEAEIKGRAEDGTITIACGEAVYEAANLLLCTGSETVIPPIPGLAETAYWTSREALQSKELPTSLVIIGGGVIGMEFASFFNSMGTEVHVVEMLDKILGPMDKELSDLLQAEYAKRGVKFYLGHKVTAVNGSSVTVEKNGESFVIEGEKVLLSVGRRPVTKGFGLETIAPEPFRNGIQVNEYMQTSVPNVYACGDITAFSLLAHTAVSEAEVAIDHLLGKERRMSYKAIPGVVYTNPEIAGVGKTEEELQATGISYTVKKIPMAFSGRFVAENEQGNGVCKLILAEDETVIGAHLLGNPASELIVIAGMAIEKGMKAEELKAIIFPHPTVGEILKEAL
ncbi:MAG: dihydrolipoyl dehydrogenase [Parabacteroides distasonis]|nr:dihydrolipoyl dehydrogenase [Parabacteroides distasonis]MBR2497035.1 dihydrolipoyl dehydrogenase [Parabacteroides sp.]